MAAKGSAVKTEMLHDIMKLFSDAFSPDGKEIRVNMTENGEPVQIKVTLTAVKTPISNSPKSEVINQDALYISEDEKKELENTLSEMGVTF